MKISFRIFMVGLVLVAVLLTACSKSTEPLQAQGNLLWPSEQFDHKNWLREGIISVSPDTVVAPDGNKSAYAIIENTAPGRHRLITLIQGVTPDKPHVFSIYAKAAGRSKMMLELLEGQSKKYGVVTYDLLTLKLLASSGDVIRGGVEQEQGDWVRCWAETPFGGNAADINLVNSEGTPNYAGDGKSGLILWGAQLSPGTDLLRYTATTNGPSK